jgi:hypothetical protein
LILRAFSDSEDENISEIIKSAHMESLQGFDDDGDEMEEGNTSKDAGLRTKNELIGEIGPVVLPDISISSTHVIECLGTVENTMGSVAIVKATTGGEYKILNEGAIVVSETRDIVGTVNTVVISYNESRFPKLLALSNSLGMS